MEVAHGRRDAVPLSAEQNNGENLWYDVNVTFDFFASLEEGGLGCVMVGDVAGTWATAPTSHVPKSIA